MDSSTELRRIIHIDCDCFFASVEQLDDPSIANIPVAVGGNSPRSVLTTANYAARAFGVRSAMPSWKAKQLCPQLLIKPVRMQRYQEVSKQVMAILRQHCDSFEQVSVDEAYLDVSQYYRPYGSARDLARFLQQQVKEQVGIGVSAGVSFNKLLAKLASDWRKPSGITTIAPDKALDFLADLPLKKLPGIGPKTAEKLSAMQYHNCRDLWQARDVDLVKLGSFAQRAIEMSKGIDHRRVANKHQRKSVGVERTFDQDLQTLQQVIDTTLKLLPAARQRLAGRQFDHISVKLKFNNFQQTTAAAMHNHFSEEIIRQLCQTAWQRQQRPVRLVGLQFQLSRGPQQQPILFD